MNPKPYIVLYGTYKKTEVFGKHLSNHSFVAFTSFWRLSCSRIVQLHYWQQFLILETLKIYKLRPNEQLLLLPHLLVLPHFPLYCFCCFDLQNPLFKILVWFNFFISVEIHLFWLHLFLRVKSPTCCQAFVRLYCMLYNLWWRLVS